MKPSRKISDIHEVVVNTPLFEESTLRVGDKVIHERTKPGSKHLGNDLGNSVNETDRAVVHNLLRSILLGQQNDVCRIEPVEVCCLEVGELMDYPHDVILNYVPTFLEEGADESIRPRRLVSRHEVNGRFDSTSVMVASIPARSTALKFRFSQLRSYGLGCPPPKVSTKCS